MPAVLELTDKCCGYIKYLLYSNKSPPRTLGVLVHLISVIRSLWLRLIHSFYLLEGSCFPASVFINWLIGLSAGFPKNLTVNFCEIIFGSDITLGQ